MQRPIRLMIADDHALFRQGLHSMLRLQEDVTVVGEVDKASELAAALASTPCDVLLLDLLMERSALEDIAALAEQVRIIVVTASERPEDALAAVRLGARAVVRKRFAIETLMAAVRAVADGYVWLPPELQAEVTAEWRAPRGERLTGREREIVRYVALGLRNAEVAQRLHISEVTVKTHLNNVFQKLGVRDRVELTLYAVRAGIIDPHERAP